MGLIVYVNLTEAIVSQNIVRLLFCMEEALVCGLGQGGGEVGDKTLDK